METKLIPWDENPATLVISAPDGRTLLAIENDGTVTGEIEDATDAAAVFVRELRVLLASGPVRVKL